MDTNTIMNGLSMVLVLGVMMVLLVMVLKQQNADDSTAGTVKKAVEDGGVDKMLAALRRYATMHDFVLLTPAKVKSGEKVADLDALLVTYAGVVGVKCLGMNGQVFANPGDENWLRVAGDTRESFRNPLDVRAADVRVLRDVLAEAKLRTVKIECL
ncbi:MAG: hypothetical protein RR075_05140, partial [Pygmaiobacter sp.]